MGIQALLLFPRPTSLAWLLYCAWVEQMSSRGTAQEATSMACLLLDSRHRMPRYKREMERLKHDAQKSTHRQDGYDTSVRAAVEHGRRGMARRE